MVNKLDKHDIYLEVQDKNLMTDSLGDTSHLKISDQMKDTKKNNFIVLFDAEGNELGRSNNKVVASGRVESIEVLFRKYDISEKNNIIYDKPDNKTNPRWISTFGVGSGGAPLAEALNPYIVNSRDTELTSPLMFRRDGSAIDPKDKYWDNFKKKDFSGIYLNWDKQVDDVFALLICELNYDDLMGQIINEIGLYYCNHIYGTGDQIVDKQKFSLYAKSNFNSIAKSPLKNGSSYKIAYKVFI